MSNLPSSQSRNDDAAPLPQVSFATCAQCKVWGQLFGAGYCAHCHIGHLETRIKALVAVSETKPRWIPVAERQPPCANNYLATLTYPDGEKHVQERYFSMRGTWNSDYVSHWQPLPEAAK